MWTIPSAGRWIFLLSLMLVVIFSTSEVDSDSLLNMPCCANVTTKRPKVVACFEQNPRSDCKHHAFVVKTKAERFVCISPKAEWLLNRIEKGKLNCTSY